MSHVSPVHGHGMFVCTDDEISAWLRPRVTEIRCNRSDCHLTYIGMMTIAHCLNILTADHCCDHVLGCDHCCYHGSPLGCVWEREGPVSWLVTMRSGSQSWAVMVTRERSW